ncbi:hypothetical protein PR048_021725 [Dryococelus australis]|uniref:Uncharacterized protein n=1 Tax=Dryococelus australis TaxID=614101 RepID=A0ABQ9GZ33_9NEOP|nr:hypothetical protein PR048_021725 [Dryococelus australis]
MFWIPSEPMQCWRKSSQKPLLDVFVMLGSTAKTQTRNSSRKQMNHNNQKPQEPECWRLLAEKVEVPCTFDDFVATYEGCHVGTEITDDKLIQLATTSKESSDDIPVVISMTMCSITYK